MAGKRDIKVVCGDERDIKVVCGDERDAWEQER